ncbi:MAG: acyl-CoA dehydrogenase [Deltaproteobacteria bacterium]|nr:acyl-CoA dehydrogenase [Deltaproteobacteria bacterium]
MSDTLVNLRDIRFVLYEMLDVETLTKYDYFADYSRDTFDIVLDAAYKLAREVCWPSYAEMDRIGASFDAKTGKTSVPECMHRIWQAYKEGGWGGETAPVEVGGQQLPACVAAATSLMFNAANTSANMYVAGAGGAAGLILSFGSDALKKTYLEKLYGGEWGGTMCLTEPQAGSSLSDVKTTAVKASDGDHYLLTGTKCFISSGDQDLTDNIVHPVLARIPGSPPGVKGISLFIVPKYRVDDDGSVGEFNDVVTAGIEHKLGIRGNATATLNFGDSGKCRGWLLGEPNRGLTYMFQLMNHARIGTGLQATSLAANAYQHALQYTRERLQSRKISEKDPTSPQVPIIKHSDVRRMLLAQKATTEGMFALLAYAAYLGDKERCSPDETERLAATDILDVLTPVCKAYGSEASYESIVLAIQCYGGYGFSEEFPLAQMLRDCKVFPIYEGTNGIQAMDLLGRKVVMKNGVAFKAVLDEISKTVAEAAQIEPLKDMAGKVAAALEAVGDVTGHLAGIAMGGDIELYMSAATPYLRMFSRLIISWLLLWQATLAQKALEAGTGEKNFYQGKLGAARFYLGNELPQLHATAQILKNGERTALDFDEACF